MIFYAIAFVIALFIVNDDNKKGVEKLLDLFIIIIIMVLLTMVGFV